MQKRGNLIRLPNFLLHGLGNSRTQNPEHTGNVTTQPMIAPLRWVATHNLERERQGG